MPGMSEVRFAGELRPYTIRSAIRTSMNQTTISFRSLSRAIGLSVTGEIG